MISKSLENQTMEGIKISKGKDVKEEIILRRYFFSGYVFDKNNNPLPRAKVRVGKQNVLTNDKGFFKIVVMRPDDGTLQRHVLNIRKKGYGLVSVICNQSINNGKWYLTKGTVSLEDPTEIIKVTDKRPKNLDCRPLSSRINWTKYKYSRYPYRFDKKGKFIMKRSKDLQRVKDFIENLNACNKGISIKIPKNSLVDSRGNPPVGKVEVSVSTVDIYDLNSMPGDYTVDLGNRTGAMVTLGAGIIEITAGRNKYNLSNDAEAEIRIPINENQVRVFEEARKKPPEIIPLLEYNESNGMWFQIGEAELDWTRKEYVGKVKHFTAYNMDIVFTDQACLVVDCQGIAENSFHLEVSHDFDPPVFPPKQKTIDNTVDKIHVIYRLPRLSLSLTAFLDDPLDGTVPLVTEDVVSGHFYSASETPNVSLCGDVTVYLRTPPKKLLIHNTLPCSETDDSCMGSDWNNWNSIYSVKVAQTTDDLDAGIGTEMLTPNDDFELARIAYAKVIAPGEYSRFPIEGISPTEFEKDIDLRELELANDQPFYIEMQCGYLEIPENKQVYVGVASLVEDCNDPGGDLQPKIARFRIEPPFPYRKLVDTYTEGLTENTFDARKLNPTNGCN